MKTRMKWALLALLAGFAIANGQNNTVKVNNAGATANITYGNNSLILGQGAGGGATTTGVDNVFSGYNSGAANTAGSDNSFLGFESGKINTTGNSNTFLGSKAGAANNTSSNNTFVGKEAGTASNGGNNSFFGTSSGKSTTTGNSNTFIGNSAGNLATTSSYNTFIGDASGSNITTGSENAFVGYGVSMSGSSTKNVCVGETIGGPASVGNNNCVFGNRAGYHLTGDRNVLLGDQAGYNQTISDQLWIENTSSATPLIWGDFSSDQVKLNGKTGIGAVSTFPTNPSYANYKLFVTGGILTDEVRVKSNNGSGSWADYVFAKDYRLKPLSEVETYINENGHLPNVPSAERVKEDGLALGEISKIQQEKIEELTLYIIEQNKINKKQGEEIEQLKAMVQTLLNKK